MNFSIFGQQICMDGIFQAQISQKVVREHPFIFTDLKSTWKMQENKTC